MYVKNAPKHWKSIHINKVSFGERICIHFLRLVFIYPHKRTQNWSTMANEMTHNFFHWLNDPSQSLLQFHIIWSRESKRHRHKSKSNDRKRNQKRNYGKWKAQKLELQNDDWLSLSTTSLFGWFFKIVQFAAWFPHSNPFWSEKIRIRKRWELSWVIPKFRSQNSDRTSVDTFDTLHLIAHRMVWWTAW